jgi:hypothetical protein
MPNGKMSTSRLEAFSDGVIAIIVTIMVLQLTHPAEPTFASLLKQAPIFLSYALSFLVVAIMWVNHHHLIHAVREVTPRLLWSNINLLFWMSLTPFVTDFMGRNSRTPFPVSLYGFKPRDVRLRILAASRRTRSPAPARPRDERIPLARADQELVLRIPLPCRRRPGARLDLHSVLRLRADPGDVFSAREKAGGREGLSHDAFATQEGWPLYPTLDRCLR